MDPDKIPDTAEIDKLFKETVKDITVTTEASATVGEATFMSSLFTTNALLSRIGAAMSVCRRSGRELDSTLIWDLSSPRHPVTIDRGMTELGIPNPMETLPWGLHQGRLRQPAAEPPRSEQRRKRIRPGPNNRCRAARACRRCNQKRVKCDAIERGTPCSQCVDRGEFECTLIKSRRGTYSRKVLQDQKEARGDQSNTGEGNDDGADAAHNVHESSGFPTSFQLQHQDRTTDPTERVVPILPDHTGSTSSQTQMAQSDDAPSWEPDTSPSAITDHSDVSQHREISWSELFSHLLEDRDKASSVVDKDSITYLGESFPLALVLKDLAGSRGRRWRRLHHPGPQCSTNNKPSDASADVRKAFVVPDRDVTDAFVRVFIDRFYPLYPIVNIHEFTQQHKADRLPWMLLHAVCLVAATYGPMHLIYKAGFESRREARWAFYSRAKALFDIGYEENKIVALQVTILMTFWGGEPNMYWNFYSWISTGVTLAETMGCHRSMTGTNIRLSDQSLLKRLWWALVIRDTSCATLVGRPFRINLDHCDTSLLTMPDDFECEAPAVSSLYQIEASKLSLILRDITKARFSPRSGSSYSPMIMQQHLVDWRHQLPAELSWSDAITRHSNIFASCLAVTYNHHVILSHMGCPADLTQTGPSSEELAIFGAQQIASITCGVITRSEILAAPHEFLHAIFIAAVVFYKQTKSSESMVSQLGMAGLTNCQMVLYETNHFWDPSPWIRHILEKIINAKATASGPSSPTLAAVENSKRMGDRNLNILEVDEDLSLPLLETLAAPEEFDLWQNYPVLGNLFDMPTGVCELVAKPSALPDRQGGIS
ncbi:Cutinase transcription factor 1 alpha [Paramyrothecium foliicola]|nr:Cutinase transcription factor 1 alpha [Paramyrothecium foliicola]